MKCEATTEPILYWTRDIDFPQCTRNASVIIDDIPLCLQHAGTIAVQKLIHMGMATMLKETGPLCDTGIRWAKHIR